MVHLCYLIEFIDNVLAFMRRLVGAERGVAKTDFCGSKRNIPHLVKWGMLHFSAYKGDFVTSASESARLGEYFVHAAYVGAERVPAEDLDGAVRVEDVSVSSENDRSVSYPGGIVKETVCLD